MANWAYNLYVDLTNGYLGSKNPAFKELLQYRQLIIKRKWRKLRSLERYSFFNYKRWIRKYLLTKAYDKKLAKLETEVKVVRKLLE